MALDRVIALVDMDCFYVQVEQRINPSLYGKPCAVVQYNHWKGGAIIAVGYEARAFGVTRNMRGDDAKAKCPEIILARVPEARGKADLTRYREAGAEIITVLQTFSVCERASVDEAYLDLTEEVERSLDTMTLENLAEETLKCSHIVGFTDQSSSDQNDIKGQWLAALSNNHNRRLAMGAIIVQRAREAVKEKTQFTCSAGIAHNKMLAKLAAGSHKPNQQTLLAQESVLGFFQTIPIRKVRHFGGKFGQSVMSNLQIEKMSELAQFTQDQLRKLFGEKSGTWLYYVSKGVEHETVQSRQLPKSTGCGKNFTGKMKLVSREKVGYWMLQLSAELCDRLKGEETRNHRMAKLVSVGFRMENGASGVRSFPLRTSPDPQSICDTAMQVIKVFNSGTGDVWHPAVVSLSINASKLEETSKGQCSSIANFFDKKETSVDDENVHEKHVASESNDSNGNAATSEAVRSKSSPKKELSKSTEDLAKQKGLKSQKREENSSVCNYERDEIDQSVVDELPDDLRNEIQAFLGIPKSSEKKKRNLNGIQKYTLSEKRTFQTRETSYERDGVEIACGASSSSGRNADSQEPEPVKCDRCGETMPQSKISEHLDYHFAMDLQKNSEIVSGNVRQKSPPKKRQKSTIDSFFVSKIE